MVLNSKAACEASRYHSGVQSNGVERLVTKIEEIAMKRRATLAGEQLPNTMKSGVNDRYGSNPVVRGDCHG